MIPSNKKFGFTSEEGKFIDLGLPPAEMEGGYLNTFYRTLVILGSTLSSVDDPKDIRIPLICDFLVSLVTDDEIRDEIREHKKALQETMVRELKESGAKLTNEEMGKIVREVNMAIVGEVVSFFDQFSGLTHKLAVGTI